MISSKTEKHIRYIYDPGATYGILRFRLERSPRYEFILIPHPHRKSFTCFSILVLTGTVLFLFWRALFGRLLIPEAIFSVAVMSPLFFCLMSEVFLVFQVEEIVKSMNQWFVVIQNAGNGALIPSL
jgi:hypothetical protein